MGRLAHQTLNRAIIALLVGFLLAGSAAADMAPRLKPPPPGPIYLSVADHTHLSLIADALKKKRFAEATTLIPLIQDPVARSLGQWLYFKAEDPQVGVFEADAFLDAHGDWPAVSRIQSFIEGRMPDDTPAETVLAFFDTRDPVTGDGKVQLARALFAVGEIEAAEIHLRDAWVNHNFTVKEEQRILASYGRRLNAADHAARVDRLLWERQVTNARRIFPRLSANERRKAEARAALLLRASSAPKLFQNLSRDNQLDSGVLHAAVRFFRRTGEEQYAIALSGDAPETADLLRNASRWWQERQLLMRWALKEGRFEDAYGLAAHHGLEVGGDLSEAEFNAGWIALRFLNQPERAETHFLALASAVETPISLARAYYWLGRAAQARSQEAQAQSYYAKAAEHYYTFYGQLAAEQLGGDALQLKFGPVAVATPEDKAYFSSRPNVAALRMLSDLRLDYEFMVFAYHIDDELDRPGEYVELARLANGEGAPHLTVRAGKVAIRRKAFAPNVAYPTVFVPEEAKRFVSPEIVLGLSRQESEFNPRAFSSAGARGMMQLIPSTARLTARKEGLPYSRTALLDDPIYNMTIGSAHLSHLIDRFDGSLALTFAAYNAGASRADQWIERYGDPRSPNVDPVDWIELVPFEETRNYIQRVLENIQVYRGQLNDAPITGQLSSDIERGGPRGRIAQLTTPSATLARRAAEHASAKALPPLPAYTQARVDAFLLAQAEMSAPADPSLNATVSEEVGPATSSTKKTKTNRRSRPTGKARRTSNAHETAPTPVAVITAAPTESPTSLDAAALPAPSPAMSVESDHAPLNPTTPKKITADGNPADDPPLAAADLAIDVNSDEAMTAAASAVSAHPVAASDAPAIAAAAHAGAKIQRDESPETSAAQALSFTSAPVDAVSTQDGAAMDSCLTYREFLARNSEGETTAADLNAGMLAALQSGGDPCG